MTPRTDQALTSFQRLFRRYWVLIIALGLVAAAATFAYSFTRDSKYEAVAEISFAKESQSNAIAGVLAQQLQTAAQLAATGAASVLDTDVLTKVGARLGSRDSASELRSRLSVEVDATTNLVKVTATDHDPRFAAALANGVASQSVRDLVFGERRRFRTIATSVRNQIKAALARQKPKDFTGALAAVQGFSERLASLQTLAVSAQPADVSSVAGVPDSPSSPKPIRDTLIGLFVGLVVALVIAFLREAFDRRLRDGEEAQELLDLPALAVLRREAFGRLPFLGSGEAVMDAQDVEALRILRSNVQLLKPDGGARVIAVTSPLPQEGKSTVAAGLALAAAAAGDRTVLVECDLRRPCLRERLELADGPGLTDYLAGQADPQQAVRGLSLPVSAMSGAGEEHQLAVIPAGTKTARPSELLGSPRFRELVDELSATFDTVIIDTPPLLSVADTREVLPGVDAVLLCVRADQTTRRQALAARSALERVQGPVGGLAITGVIPRGDTDYGYYSATYLTPA